MINELKVGQKFLQPAILKVQKIGNSSNGGVFARGMLEDNSGRLPFICFDAAQVEKLREVDGNIAFMVQGNVDINKFANDMSLQIIVQKLNELLSEDDLSPILPQGDFDHEAYKQKLANFIRMVKTPPLRMLLENIFSGNTYDAFVRNPAGMKMHHAYLGGLLQHSVDVCSLAVAMGEQTGDVDMDLIIAGALLHDLGKIKEISSAMGFPYTTEGRLLGHITMSALMVQETAVKMHLPAARLEQLLHILLSHHGENDKGSPVACATREAFLVHYADEINAIMNQFDTYDGKNTWDYNRMMGRNLLMTKI